MSRSPELTTVPRDLYYHEVAYVRDLENELKRADAVVFKLVRVDPSFTPEDADRCIDRHCRRIAEKA